MPLIIIYINNKYEDMLINSVLISTKMKNYQNRFIPMKDIVKLYMSKINKYELIS